MGCEGGSFLHDGECKLCACPKILKPVCSYENKTFDNRCLLDCENAEFKHNGVC